VVLWAVAVLALLVACAALARARRLGRRLDALNQSYWELRYDYTRLRSQVARLDPEQSAASGAASAADVLAPPEGPPSVSFVPLSSIRRKEQ
jgi:hypothetical protein